MRRYNFTTGPKSRKERNSRTQASSSPGLASSSMGCGTKTIVMITHNPEIAKMADRVVRIEDGRIVEDGLPPINDHETEGGYRYAV